MGPCWDGDSVKLHLEGAESNINTYTFMNVIDGDGDGEGNDDFEALNLVSK